MFNLVSRIAKANVCDCVMGAPNYHFQVCSFSIFLLDELSQIKLDILELDILSFHVITFGHLDIRSRLAYDPHFWI